MIVIKANLALLSNCQTQWTEHILHVYCNFWTIFAWYLFTRDYDETTTEVCTLSHQSLHCFRSLLMLNKLDFADDHFGLRLTIFDALCCKCHASSPLECIARGAKTTSITKKFRVVQNHVECQWISYGGRHNDTELPLTTKATGKCGIRNWCFAAKDT